MLGKYETISTDLKVSESDQNKQVNKSSVAEFSAADLLFRLNSDTKNQSACANRRRMRVIQFVTLQSDGVTKISWVMVKVSFVIRNIEKYSFAELEPQKYIAP